MNEGSKKKKIILLSDLWGKEKSDWITHYITALENHFDITYYDSCDLGNVDKNDYVADKLHSQFVAGGVASAVEIMLQKERKCFAVLGFSIGGLIAWKACLAGLKAQNLFAISATRLRYETLKPAGNIALFYGENDTYKPDSNWCKRLNISAHLYKNEEHELYKKKEIAHELCRRIIQQSQIV